ncbi:MAG: hypothetical protein WCD79_15530 [Chthoniobacteraceae bacterium]
MNFIWSFMEANYAEFVVSAVLGADEKGEIKIPNGSGWETEHLIKNLTELETMGFVSRQEGSAPLRPFQLTNQGKTLKAFLAKAEIPVTQPT